MSRMTSESVETITASNTPLCSAAQIVYAISGCPASGRMFLSGTRFDPERAGIRAMAVGWAGGRERHVNLPGV